MKTVCKVDQCAGCMACVDTCAKSAIKIVDDLRAFNAVIDEGKCVGCNACYHVCQINNVPDLFPQIKWYQGWALDEAIRSRGASGGVATALALSFVRKEGVVCNCVFEDGDFIFQFAHSEEEVLRASGSKYVKSNPRGCYKKIKALLQHEKKVLFIGLPCQVAAVKKYVGRKYFENLYTVDLICHGTPSRNLLDQFLEEKGYNLGLVQDLGFRNKIQYKLAIQGKPIMPAGMKDAYILSFVNGLTFTETCYSCHYARTERVADVTLGDSWGSELEESVQKKGVSLVLCQTPKGVGIVEDSNLNLLPVDLKSAIAGNDQLNAPAKRPVNRDSFFDGISTGKRFSTMVGMCYPRQYGKQQIKYLLIKFIDSTKRMFGMES